MSEPPADERGPTRPGAAPAARPGAGPARAAPLSPGDPPRSAGARRWRGLLFGLTWRGFALRVVLAFAATAGLGAAALPIALPYAVGWAGGLAKLELTSARASVALLDGVLVLEDVEGRPAEVTPGDPEIDLRVGRLEVRADPFSIARDRRIALVRVERPRVVVRGLPAAAEGAESPLLARLERLLDDLGAGGGRGPSGGSPFTIERLEVVDAEVIVEPGAGDPLPRLEASFAFEGSSLGAPRAAFDLRAACAPLFARAQARLAPLADGPRAGARVEVDVDRLDLRPLAAALPTGRPTLADGRLQLAWDVFAASPGAPAGEVIVHRAELLDRGEPVLAATRIRVVPAAPRPGASSDASSGASSGAPTALAVIEVERPVLRLRRTPEGRIEGAGLVLHDPEAPPRAEPGEPGRGWRVDRLRVLAGQLRFDDDAQAGAPPVLVDDLDLMARGLTSEAGAPPAILAGRWRGGQHAKAGGFHARLALAPSPRGEAVVGLFGVDGRLANAYSEPLAEVKVTSGTLALRLDAKVADGVLDVTPRVLADRLHVVGAGASRPLPGAGERTLASILQELRDGEGAIDIRLPVRIELARVMSVSRELGGVRGRLQEIAARARALEARLRERASAEAQVALAALEAERAALRAERDRLSAEQQRLLGVSPTAIVGEVVRQTLGGAVDAFTSLFTTRPPPLRLHEVAAVAGEDRPSALERERLRVVVRALGGAPRGAVLVRGAAHAGRDDTDPDALSDLAERRALAVRDALVELGAPAAQVLVGRPLDATQSGAPGGVDPPGARIEPIR